MTDQPASTAPAAAAHPLVKGRCPACNGSSLFLGSGGYVTCARLDCPDPTAADDLLHRGRAATTGRWLLEGTRDLSIPQQTPEFTARPVTPEMERAATERAQQAAEASERSAAWIAENSSPQTDAEQRLARIADYLTGPNKPCCETVTNTLNSILRKDHQ